MSQRVHLRVAGIPGEASDDGYKDWIPVLSFYHTMGRWDGDRFSTPAMEFGLTKSFDKASPLLALACSEGWRVDEAVLAVCTNQSNRPKLMEIRLRGVSFSSYQLSGAQHGGEEPPCESLNLRFEKIEWIYHPEASGGRPVQTSWTSEDYREPAKC